MKYLVFFTMLGLGVPLMALAASLSARVRSWLLTALIIATALDITASINFISMEFYRGTDRGFEVTLTDLIAWSLIPALLILFPRRVRYLPFNTGWMVLLFALACLSFTLVDEPIYTAFSLWKMVRLYLVYWCVFNCLETGVPLRAVWRGIMAVAVLTIAYAFQQKYLQGLYRVKGTLHHPNSLSSYLLPIMPFLAFWGFGERNPLGFRAMASIVVALGVAMVVMVSQSRVGLALILVNVPAVLLMVNRWRPTRVTRFLSLIVVVGMVLAGLKGADTIWKRFANAQSAAGRTELNQTAALMMADHPLLGVGLNQYPRLASDTPEYRAHLVRMANEEQLGVAHHMYWLTVAEMGILGLLVYLIIVFRFWWLACRHAWQRGSPGSLLLAGYMIGVGSVHLQALYEWVLRQTSVAYMFLVMSAVCVWLAGRARTGATPEVAL